MRVSSLADSERLRVRRTHNRQKKDVRNVQVHSGAGKAATPMGVSRRPPWNEEVIQLADSGPSICEVCARDSGFTKGGTWGGRDMG